MSAALAQPDPATLVDMWRNGITSVDPRQWHPPGMLAAQPRFGAPPWHGVHAAMLAFLDAWSLRAAELGWTTEQLFGVHVRAGAVRADSTGALVSLYPMQVVALDARQIVFARGATRQTFRGLTNPAESIPFWLFGRRDGQPAG